jgi:hypothetical protein
MSRMRRTEGKKTKTSQIKRSIKEMMVKERRKLRRRLMIL